MNAIFSLIILFAGAFLLRIIIQKVKSISGHKTKLILAIYAFVLLISVPITYVLPVNPSTENSKLSPSTLHEARQGTENFYKAFNNGTFANTEGIFEDKTWRFPFEDHRLAIRSNLDEQWILVKRKKMEDPHITVIRYTTKYMLDEFDYTHLIDRPEISLENGIMQIISPHTPIELNLTKFDKEFTIKQFTEENMFEFGYIHERGKNALYIEVPDDVEIVTSKNLNINIVEE